MLLLSLCFSAGITAADLETIPASYMSSISSSALQYMPAAKLNLLTMDQLNGLSTEQVASLVNSPYYSSFSSSIKTGLASLAANTKAIEHSSGLVFKAYSRTISICLSLQLIRFF